MPDIVAEAYEFRNMVLKSPPVEPDQHVSSYFTPLYPLRQMEHAVVKPKALADLVEAIIGGFYVNGGLEAGVSAIKALGAWPKLPRRKAVNPVEKEEREPLIPKIDINSFQKQELVFPAAYPEPLKKIALGVRLAKDGMETTGAMHCIVQREEER